MRWPFHLFVLATVATSLAGCASAFTEGIGAYDHGRYPEALEALSVVEPDAASWSEERRARYALYRGLVHLALGDPESTRRWLGEAQRAFDQDPRILTEEDAGRLHAAVAHLRSPL